MTSAFFTFNLLWIALIVWNYSDIILKYELRVKLFNPEKATFKKHDLIRVNFMSSKDNYDKQWMNSKCTNIEIMIGNETGETNKLFKSHFNKYQLGL